MFHWHVPEASGYGPRWLPLFATQTGECHESIIMHNIQLIIGVQRASQNNKNKHYKYFELRRFFRVNRAIIKGGSGEPNLMKWKKY